MTFILCKLYLHEVKVEVLVTQPHLTLETLWTAAHQALLPMGFYRQEDWSGLPFPSPGDLPNPEVEPRSPALQEVSCIVGRFFTT